MSFQEPQLRRLCGKFGALSYIELEAKLTAAEAELSALREDKARLITTLRQIKHWCLTTKETRFPELLGRPIRLCIDAGVKESCVEIEQLLTTIDRARQPQKENEK